MSVFISLEEVLKIAEENPNQKIWCISETNDTADFITTAKEIKDSMGNLSWSNIKFRYSTT